MLDSSEIDLPRLLIKGALYGHQGVSLAIWLNNFLYEQKLCLVDAIFYFLDKLFSFYSLFSYLYIATNEFFGHSPKEQNIRNICLSI